MIKVDGLVKAFGVQKILDGISFEIPAGTVCAVMGPSGTGKSVLLLHLVGLIRPDAGRIEVDGACLDELDEQELLVFRRRVGYLFQDGALFDFMTVQENLAFPLREHTRLRETEIREKVAHFLALVDLTGAGAKYPVELSGGMRKRAALARSMIGGAKILLCDEPTSGLDPVRSRDISLLIRDLSVKMGCTTVFTTHDARNALRTADRLIMLKDGRIAASGSAADLRQESDPFVRAFLE